MVPVRMEQPRHRLGSRLHRRAVPLLRLCGALYLGLVAATFAASSRRGFLWNGALERHLWLGEAAALVGVAVGVAWALLVGSRARATVAQLVVELAQAPPPGGLRPR